MGEGLGDWVLAVGGRLATLEKDCNVSLVSMERRV